ncbi:DUF1295-domain-containing protein [Hygrophoropsis aurantiaca]|uniref:DUF1295-domain-containing protein n=1 Tax=Hygrophoropsis aurantiaca TaxID=72124 RepID=A0ACB8A4U0_9AGAM|nr:DUF1295-domain-containing protein [Hygrophoropsis aurantiaca]
MAIMSRLVPTAFSAFALQAAFAAIFVPQHNEKFYDLCGAAGFITSTLVSLRLNRTQPNPLVLAPRQLLLTAAITIWSARLGSFLATRALKAGGDPRFDKIKHEKGTFTAIWMLQAAWVFVIGLPVYITNALPAAAHPPLGPRDFVALALLTSSFVLEVTADRQKSNWRAEKNQKKHDENFITRGLWGLSRHPNYVGEVGIWTSMWGLASASGALPWPAVLAAAASPVGTYLLIRYVSGVPPLERSGDKKFGDDPKWAEYKRTVPVFFPWGGYE